MAFLATTARAGAVAALVAATYPLALGAQTGIDALYGDGLLLAELQHGPRRALAQQLVSAWLASLALVIGLWCVLILLRRIAPRAYPGVVAAALAVLAATAAFAGEPAIFACLVAAAALLLEIGRRLLQKPQWI